MKEHPILFSTPMVQAILAGKKTQTRRVIKFPENPDWALAWHRKSPSEKILFCPYGIEGDRLWVRETWAHYFHPHEQPNEPTFVFKADYENGNGFVNSGSEIRWKPSIHMPRSASRITLEITNVRVERLQDISKEDAIEEGIRAEVTGDDLYENYAKAGYRWVDAITSYGSLWESINGPGSWEANLWVWVIEFRFLPLDRKAINTKI